MTGRSLNWRRAHARRLRLEQYRAEARAKRWIFALYFFAAAALPLSIVLAATLPN